MSITTFNTQRAERRLAIAAVTISGTAALACIVTGYNALGLINAALAGVCLWCMSRFD